MERSHTTPGGIGVRSRILANRTAGRQGTCCRARGGGCGADGRLGAGQRHARNGEPRSEERGGTITTGPPPEVSARATRSTRSAASGASSFSGSQTWLDATPSRPHPTGSVRGFANLACTPSPERASTASSSHSKLRIANWQLLTRAFRDPVPARSRQRRQSCRRSSVCSNVLQVACNEQGLPRARLRQQVPAGALRLPRRDRGGRAPPPPLPRGRGGSSARSWSAPAPS